MNKPLEFWFEFASTYSYPAAMRVEEACIGAKVDLIWRPFLLGPVFAQQGMTDSPFNIFPVKGAYMWRDLERVCAAQGLNLRKPSSFPRGSLLAARICAAFDQSDWVSSFIRAVYDANFAMDLDIGEAKVLEDLLDALGQDPEAVITEAQSPENKKKLKTMTEEAIERGVFGAPIMIIGEEVFWGNDRLEAAISWAVGGRE
ncbi:MAG: 2-hydroxychromene-2-carboxylate isomerase [Pseudomonadota bacterium]